MVQLNYDPDRDELVTAPPRPPDERYVYSSRCSFHGPVCQIGRFPTKDGLSLPCCPSCRAMLLEVANKTIWDALVANHAKIKNDADYPAFVKWFGEQRPCQPIRNQADFDELRRVFNTLLNP